MVDAHHFQKVLLNIVYRPLLNIHKNMIKERIKQYNKFDKKLRIFAILEDPKSLGHILFQKPKK
jgi:hypothetical protein